MSAWDLFVAFNFAVLIGALLWFVIGHWIDERRQKREESQRALNDGFASLDEWHADFIRRYREHR